MRQNLLDLSMRNQLLNFRPRTRVVRVVDEIPTEIYNILVIKEKEMEFLPKKVDDEVKFEPEDSDLLWELPPPDLSVKGRHKDLFLQTNYEGRELQRRLFNISQQRKSIFLEQGYNVLYLALGILEWLEDEKSNDYRKAPLIIIPVELERKAVKRPFKLSWNKDDIITNISLKAKLKEQGINLPDFEMPEDKEGVYDYIKSVKAAVSSMKDWNVKNDIYLGFFSFTKFVMYQDLDPKNWPEEISFHESPVVNAIFNSKPSTDDLGFNEEDVDSKLKSENIYTVLDADSSQIAVIEDVKAGKNLVVEGPPGTGKSQTIVNLIAELLGSGKTILFVSEKMAALEVVKSRLDSIGLGDFCFELHSRHANKREALNELKRTLKASRKSTSISYDDFYELDHIKVDLNYYNKVVHKPFGKIAFSPFQLIGMKEQSLNHFNKKSKKSDRVIIKKPLSYSREHWTIAINKLKDISDLLKEVQPVKEHPWRYCNPESILPSDQQDIGEILCILIPLLDEIKLHGDDVSELTGVRKSINFQELEESLKNAIMISESEIIEEELLKNSMWDSKDNDSGEIIEYLIEYRKYLDFLAKYRDDVLDQDLEKLQEKFKELSSKTLKILSGDYRKTKKEIYSFYTEKPDSDEAVLEDLSILIFCQQIRSFLRDHGQAKKLFGSRWHGENSDPETLQKLSQYLLEFRKLLNDGKITHKSIDVVSNGVDPDIVKREVNSVEKSVSNYRGNLMKLDGFLKMDQSNVFPPSLDEANLDEIKQKLLTFRSELDRLPLWAHFIYQKNDLPKLGRPMIKSIEQDNLDSDDIIPCFQGNFSDLALREIFALEPKLRNFVADLHENKINKFQKIDKKILKLNQNRIRQQLAENRPNHSSNSKNSELGILMNEFNRKRRHKPIRDLLLSAGSLIQSIKPCFMMSPLSLAQFIQPKAVPNLMFDVVIFDEASQVKPEDALGSLLRGKQLVVMGDTKQLPPTSFFDLMIDSSDVRDYDLESLTDMESILHLCKRSFPTKMLRWHYRSRHESLIAVSNQEFYENNLFIYPSPEHESKTLGLRFEYVPEAIYDRGRSSANKIEAEKVIKKAFDHYKQFGYEKSLGIGTFNIRQQQTIMEVLEAKLKENPEMEEFFNSNGEEPFFIKNLETIQGDERDVIMVSIGFGRDQNGKLNQNFGPLNKDGGERRLNVLITRAREKCVVFSNFRYSDLRITPESPFGLRALKVFLEYAETKELVTLTNPGEDFESSFEESVYQLLRSYGYQVDKQVGCAGYRIDLAIIDPKSPGKYLLGIECDGAMYHSSPVARDRDRLRQQILEGLGWTIYRIWSTDWYHNRSDSINKLLKFIEQIMTEKRLQRQTFTPETEVYEPINLKESSKKNEIEIDPGSEEEFLIVPLEETIPEYRVCDSLGISKNGNLADKSPQVLARSINKIVELEGPIHMDETIKRFRTLWGLKRAGKRIKNVINEAARIAERDGNIIINNDFLISTKKAVTVRKRTGDPPAKIELISLEEIEIAIKMVIKAQHATSPDDLVTQTARLFGFKSTSKKTKNNIKTVLNQLISDETLIKMPNGMVNFPK